MKKVELHLHLDGSLDVNFASGLAGRDVTGEMVSRDDVSLKQYLEKFDLPGELFQEYNNIKQFSYLLAKQLKDEDVIYAEVRFCPFFHDKKISVDRVITGIKEGFSMVDGIKLNLIFCMMRHFSFEENLRVINLTKKYLGNGVCAIDLAGDEANFKTKDFEQLFKIVREKNIPFTIHAGEADSYESVDAAVSFGAKRIGHGIRSIESMDTINSLIENNVTLEVCPDSNVDTKAVNSISEHPIKKLVDAGVLVTISTDNRTVSETSLEHEYELLRNEFGFNDNDFIKFNLNAINAAFISDEEKQELRDRLLN